MNHQSPGLLISKAIAGFLQFKTAEGLSKNTIASYQRLLEQWLDYHKDGDIDRVTFQQLRDYLTYMRTEYIPRRITGGNDQKLSSKSIRNIYVSLCAFFHWLADEFQITNPI